MTSETNDQTAQTTGARIWANVKTLVSIAVLAFSIRIVLFEAFQIEGPSMEPTLLNGDRVFVSKCFYGLFLPYMKEAVLNWGSPNPGNVVIVKSPADDVDIVKRVIGLPGDVIEIREDEVYRNGKSIKSGDLGACPADNDTLSHDAGCQWVEETLEGHVYRTSHSIGTTPTTFTQIRVPKGHVFILGDHRDRSNDSRFFGPVPIKRIKGRGLAIYWSSDTSIRWGRMFSILQ